MCHIIKFCFFPFRKFSCVINEQKKIGCSLRSNAEFISVGWHKHTSTCALTLKFRRGKAISMCTKMKWHERRNGNFITKSDREAENAFTILAWHALFQTEIQRLNIYDITFPAAPLTHQVITMPHSFTCAMRRNTQHILLNWTFEFSKFRLKTFSIYFIITIVCNAVYSMKQKESASLWFCHNVSLLTMVYSTDERQLERKREW